MQALEGKDVKDMLMNVGSGGGAAPAAAASGGGGGAAAAGDAAAEEPAAEEKEEGEQDFIMARILLTHNTRKGRVRRGHGLRSLRLGDSPSFPSRYPPINCNILTHSGGTHSEDTCMNKGPRWQSAQEEMCMRSGFHLDGTTATSITQQPFPISPKPVLS